MAHISYLIRNPHGSVLVIGLFTLALLALLGAAATSTSRTDVSISGNMRVLQEAFYASEVGLTEGELFVDSMKTEFDLDAKLIGHYDQGTQNLHKMKWDASDSIQVKTSALPKSIDTTAAPPRYTLEKRLYLPDSLVLGKPPTGIHHYNITSQGTGSSSRTTTILRTVFSERFN